MLHILQLVSLIAALPAPIASDEAQRVAASNAYEYSDCADQRDGAPLLECSKLDISNKLDRLSFADVVENFPASTSADILRLGSGYIPIVVPRNNYGDKQSWESFGRTYHKGTTKISNQLTGGRSVDTITVSDKSGRTVLTFWYSVEGGIRAIGIPQSNVDSGKVYFCTSARCLFQIDSH